MKLQVLDQSVVILAEQHNPTILHPYFLSNQGIVPKDWQLAQSPVCTPAVATVKYNNGFVFLSQPKRLQVQDTQCRVEGPNVHVMQCAQKYVENVPHVGYKAVGLNFTAALKHPHPELFLVERFLKAGPWNDGTLNLTSCGVNLTYPAESGTLTLRCDPGTFRQSNQPKESAAIVVVSNHNCDIGEGQSIVEQVRQHLSLFESSYYHFCETVRTVFNLE